MLLINLKLKEALISATKPIKIKRRIELILLVTLEAKKVIETIGEEENQLWL